MKMLLVGYCIL